ncbi:MAG: hypothetical protein P8Q36_13275 [Alphaproteobacteria bacterium]|jgi:hypothetical protein|nr:hypothetical protein [Rhodospirillaceae bacterium]MBT6510230.1 hypothetical protein [Rhodospirillaceae bacterium]MBT7614632.1 hypothetical protein [Rhodospirillaceae bacterium]MBT7645436.1 hypothetical protein [Rhodospirillaceae bacterium]MDG2481820.1 hypothetical protein [Alphaproteobacteria bacterium]
MQTTFTDLVGTAAPAHCLAELTDLAPALGMVTAIDEMASLASDAKPTTPYVNCLHLDAVAVHDMAAQAGEARGTAAGRSCVGPC